MEDQSDSAKWADAAKETAKFAQQATGAVTGTGRYFGEIARESLENAAGIFADRLRFKRAENALVLQARYEAKARELGYEKLSRPVPLSLEVPLLEAATLEDDDDLRDRWVNLLLNFANPDSGVSLQKSFVSILRELSPLEARLLDAIYAIDTTSAGLRAILTAELPHVARLEPEPDATKETEMAKDPSDEVSLALSNLRRHELIDSAAMWGGPGSLAAIYQTRFGAALLRACTLPKSQGRPFPAPDVAS